MLVERDIRAFVAGDWSMVADDFVAEGFVGVDARRAADPTDWTLSFATLDAYRAEWQRQAAEFAATRFAEDPTAALHRATDLSRIEVSGDAALAHKVFDGAIERADGGREVLSWQTVYLCRRTGGRWRIAGFTGYLPHPMGRA